MNRGSLEELLERADERRLSLVERLRVEKTDSYRVFHGLAEGRPGLTVDRYGELVLAQTFREPLSGSEIASLAARYGEFFVYNHRGDREKMFALHQPTDRALQPFLATEFGLFYEIMARHRGIDPHLFLDLRVGRRWVLNSAKGRSVLILFSYSCGMGQVAAAGGATEVWNVDFSASALEIGRRNLRHNSLEERGIAFIQEDYFPVVWQLAGLGVKGKRARRPFKRFSPDQFDLVLLDPPARAKGAFHTVDLVNDYQSVFKPAWLVTASGGVMLATNNVGTVSRKSFGEGLLRCAEKCGKPLQRLEWLRPEKDFPSFDDQPPLKVALCYA